VSSATRLTAIPGAGAIVLLAPHGGRRDPARRPGAGGRVRVNDLHTASLTTELARVLDARALINADHDRNEIDLNRVSEAHDRAPWFLEALARVLHDTLARHGHATVLVVHGWNVIEPVADLGLGCTPGPVPFAVDEGAAVSPAFAHTAVRALVRGCAARGITATLGVRYPARHRENLLQLFTTRYRNDSRPLVRAIAALAPRLDAVQVELGIPLRWPGPWRDRFVDACRAARPAFAGEAPPDAAAPELPGSPGVADHGPPARLEFTSPGLCGLVAADRGGLRLLLFPTEGGLVLFTAERTAGRPPGPLVVEPAAGGTVAVRLRGPLLRFRDTTPFLDLEPGLAGARLVEADVSLAFASDVPADGGTGFGSIAGRVTLDGVTHPIAGDAFADAGAAPQVWPRFRAALRLGGDARLALSVGLDGTHVRGALRRGAQEDPARRATLRLGPPHAPLSRFALAVELASGTLLDLEVHALHRLPVIRRGPVSPVRLEFAVCRLAGGPPGAAGWCEVGGL
jgi:hypothetical protein